MEIPESLDAWTYDTVVTVVSRHEYEPGRFDYKEVLNASREGKGDHVASIRRTVSSMANGDGGYILFGVKDRAAQDGTPMDRIVGIPRAPDLRKEFGEKLATIERDVYFDAKAIDFPSDASKCVFVVWIPTSSLRPHIDTSDGKFFIRGEGGRARPMRFFEVRDQMLYTEGRLHKVRLLRLELSTFREVANMLIDPVTRAVRFDPGPYKLLLADIGDLIVSDSGLLDMLYTIGKEATILNPLLDKREELLRASERIELVGGIPTGQVAAGIYSRCAYLSNDCGRALDRLTALFGPLSA